MSEDRAGWRLRLEELESQAAFQQDLQQRLDEIVARQDREIRELRNQVRELARRLAELREAETAATPGPTDERPPHY